MRADGATGAQFAPRSFYDDFPGFGRAWVSVDGPYNEHLVRDVGGLYLALSVLLVAAMITLSRAVIVTASVAVLASGVPHLAYHVANRDGLTSGDVVFSVGGLALFAALPVALLVVGDIDRADADTTSDRTPPAPGTADRP